MLSVEVRRVTAKKDGTVTPILFLAFNKPEMPKLTRVSYLQVKVDWFVPNPLRCFGCNKFGHTGDRCKVTKKHVYVADKISTKIRCALTARVLTHLPLKIAQSGRRRKRFSVYALTNASLSRKPDGRSVVACCATCKCSFELF